MGRYIGWPDVVDRYPDAARIAGAELVNSSWIAGAEDELDARLSPRYTVPFSSTPGMVRDLAIDLTYYKATLRQKGADKLYAYLKDRLDLLVNGTIELPGYVGATSAGNAAFVSPTYQTAFGYDDPVNWRTPEDELDATENRR